MAGFDLWKQGAKDGLPVFLGYLAVSFTFGIAARDVPRPFETVLMSAANYTSAGQFAALGLIAASASLWEVAASQLVINLRYSLMACCLSQKLERDVPAYQRFFMATGLTDEVFGLSASIKGRLNPIYTYGVMSTALPGWVLGTLLGVMSSGLMPPRVMSALGIAIYGMFIAIIFPPARNDHKLAIIIALSMACSMFCDWAALPALTPGMKRIVLSLAIAGAAAVLFPLEQRKKTPVADSAAECEESAR